MITPKWILDSVLELDLRHPYADADSGDIAAMLAAELLQRLPQDAMLSLAEVACARAALDGSDTQQCAADLVKSIVEVLAAGDTEVMSLTRLVGEAWGTLSQLGVPLGDEGSVFSLVDRIKWLANQAAEALEANAGLAKDLERAMCTIADLELEIPDDEADARASGLRGDPQ